MNIKNFESSISTKIVQRGKSYFQKKQIVSLENTEKGCYTAQVQGTQLYHVSVKISGSGEITEAHCDCPFEHGKYCKHMAAVFFAVKKRFEKEISDRSSDEALRLIREYCRLADETAELDTPEEEKVHLIPELSRYGNTLSYSLKIGRTRMYMVKDITKLKMNFDHSMTQKYGKELEFVHTYSAMDEKSCRLMDLSFMFYCSKGYYSYSKQNLDLRDNKIDSFFEMYKDCYVSFEGRKCLVKYENPQIEVKLQEESNNRFSIAVKSPLTYFGKGLHACFFQEKTDTFYLATPRFSQAVCTLFQACSNISKMYIAKSDITAFYSSVLKPVCGYVQIQGIVLLEDFIPPEAVSRLYLDYGQENEITARLEFSYGEKVYPAFYEQRSNPMCDYPAEKNAENEIRKYFEVQESDPVHPLTISDEKKIYEFITDGLPRLAKTMEIYASERFQRISVRPPVKPSIGIRPSGNLLELEITADGYSPEELTALLSAYRRGSKYHRLRDGSFAQMDDSLSALAELTSSLNITDKSLLKEQIQIPKYRMFYLDSLKSNENFRLKRSSDFKNAMHLYHTAIEDAESSAVPETLDAIMRSYQKYGFRWMKTIASYGFGGILADDMGLGKTIQAIALMLDAKKHAQEHRVNLVVCPSSLTLNWENEIRKFAPELKSLMITGTAAIRDERIAHIHEYDVIITSYSLITRDIAKYEAQSFYLEFIDEAQYIKNHSTQAAKAVKGIHAEIRFALTGTPVENSLAELWSIFDFIMPDYLFSYTYFKKNFESPIVSKNDKTAVKNLQEIVSPFILRRLKKDVLTELPDKTETILYANMEKEQSKLYSANVAAVKKMLGKEFESSTERIKILAMLTRLRQICCDPSLVYDNYKGSSGKLEQCMELIESCVHAGHKILLFSQFTSMLDRIADRLNRTEISHYMLTGKTKPSQRIQLVNDFNENDTKVFLISLKAGGTGLNLTGADIVIHYDPWWNSSAENQASDRVYRIGQKRNVQIYKLIADKTIEENIIRLQQSKSELYDIAVGGEGDIMHMSAEDILHILE
ncbi:MAG: SNF2-related protein [Ruminococcus sp.]